MEKKKIAFLVNFSSGSGKGKDFYQCIVRWLEKNAEKERIKPSFFFTEKSGKKSAENIAKEIVEKGYDILGIIGGDGTINGAVNGIFGSKIPVLVFPAGGANDFARVMKIPKKPEKVLELINKGRIELIDLGKVNDRIFINYFGVGFDAKVVEYAGRIKKTISILPNMLIYLIAFFRELLFKMKYYRLKIKLVSRKMIYKTVAEVSMIMVCNNSGCGGILKIAPWASFNDALLDICIVSKINKWRGFYFVLRALKGKHFHLAELWKNHDNQMPKTSSLIISSLNNKDIPCQVDGDLLPFRNEYYISVLPKALRVIMT